MLIYVQLQLPDVQAQTKTLYSFGTFTTDLYNLTINNNPN